MKAKSRSVVLFSRQMAVLLRNGVPLVQALETLSDQPEDEAFGVVVRDCTRKISTGHTLSNSLAGYPNVFPKVFVSMAEIGERTGSLDHAALSCPACTSMATAEAMRGAAVLV